MADPTSREIESSELGARLQAARKAARIKQEDAALAINVARTTITAIEKGDRRVQASELVVLAQLYGKSLNELVRAGVSSKPFAVQLRASLPANSPALETLEAYFAEFQSLAQDYAQLELLCKSPLPMRYPAERSVTGRVDVEELAEDVANTERDRLGLGDGPIHRLRDVLEREVGLRIFCMELPSNISGMFIFDGELGGCIAANAKHAIERIRNSIAHEYAHFLTSRLHPSIDEHSRYERVPEQERFAHAFAPAFLMPPMGLRRRFNQIKDASGAFKISDLVSLADYYGTSIESLTRRLESLKLLKRGTWESVSIKGLRVSEARDYLQLHAPSDSNDLLPPRFTVLASNAFEEGQITEGQFARFIRRDVFEARRIHQAYRAEIARSGRMLSDTEVGYSTSNTREIEG